MTNEPQPQPIKRPYRKYFTAQDKTLVNEYMATTFTDKHRQTLLIAQDHLKTSFDILKSGGFVSWIAEMAADAAKKGELSVGEASDTDEDNKGRCYIIRNTIYIYENTQKTLFESIAAKKLIAI